MKLNLFFILLLLLSFTSQGQNYLVTMDIEEYKVDTIASQFDRKFIKDSEKTNFKLLREFLREKKDLLNALQNELYYSFSAQDGKKYKTAIQKVTENLEKLIANKSPGEQIIVNPSDVENRTISDYYYRIGDYYSIDQYLYYNYDTGKYDASVESVNELITKLKEDINAINIKINTFNNLNKNIRNVNEDIYACESQIDSALAPEYKEQEFRTSISLYFTILIGVLLVVFFFIVYKKSDEHLSKELLSGQGLQFVTLFVLIIAIILFGILSILQGSELAAILAGISGYILGKGIPDKKKEGENENKTI